MEIAGVVDNLLLVEWVDSAQPVPGWRHLDDLPELEVLHCVSVGWLVGQTDTVKMLAPNLGDVRSNDNRQASGVIRIPVVAITREVAVVEATSSSFSGPSSRPGSVERPPFSCFRQQLPSCVPPTRQMPERTFGGWFASLVSWLPRVVSRGRYAPVNSNAQVPQSVLATRRDHPRRPA